MAKQSINNFVKKATQLGLKGIEVHDNYASAEIPHPESGKLPLAWITYSDITSNVAIQGVAPEREGYTFFVHRSEFRKYSKEDIDQLAIQYLRIRIELPNLMDELDELDLERTRLLQKIEDLCERTVVPPTIW